MSIEYLSPSPLSHFDPADLLDLLATGVVVLDAQLCVVYANVGAQDLLAVGLNQARGRPITELFDESQSLELLLRRSLERGEPYSGHEIALTASVKQAHREPVVVDVTVTPLDGLTGTHLLIELADARTRQRISRESEMLSRLDGSRLMIRQLAHEIRNPLGGLRGAAQLLDRELHDGSLKEYTAVIINEADRLRALVDSMLGPSRLPQKVSINIHELCEHVFHLLRSEAGAGIVIERDYDPSLPNAQFDRNEIIQALLNVARNALQAVEPGSGRVLLRTRVLTNINIGTIRHRLVANIQVEDNGHGISPELQRSVFYPLVTTRSTGTGLGLAVAQDLVTRHRGIVEFESRPGHTVFSLLLPLEGAE
ncbi:MAG TPA: nitrogen regulation protein NR(II) [Steroidobacteraceae bacterium]|jgi:two-component system nitrogen regulation sensor histidine kinase GlnL